MSSVAFSASSLQGRAVRPIRVYAGKRRGAPQDLEDALHLPDGHDLVLDLLPALRDLARRERELADRARLVLVVVRARRALVLVLDRVRPVELLLRAHGQHREQHLRDLRADERQRPREGVHEVRQPVRVRRRVELPDRDVLVLVLDHRAFVVVDVEVVRRAEDCDDGGEFLCLGLAMHEVPGPH